MRKPIATERNGLVNISPARVWPAPCPEPTRAMAWLKTTITSRREADDEGGHRLDARTLGLRERGNWCIADKNLYESEEARKFPDGRCSLENGSFNLPLEAGDNEVAVAIANNFFGWGMMLRLPDPEGVHLAAK